MRWGGSPCHQRAVVAETKADKAAYPLSDALLRWTDRWELFE